MNKQIDLSNPANTVREWVDLYAEAMLTWAMHKTSDRETAEDLVQDTFLAAVQSIQNFAGRSEPKTWLFSILNNKISDHYRKQFRSPIVKIKNEEGDFLGKFFDENGRWRKDAQPKEWENDEIHLLDEPDFRKTLQHCMHQLPPKWFLVVNLKYLEGREGREICKELEITQSNFWQIIHRAKLQLRNCLEKKWFNK